MTAKIEVCKKKRHILPLEKFVNGRVDQTKTGELTCTLLGRTEDAKLQEKEQRIMVTESPHMTYVGKNFGQSKLQHSQNLLKHYVGVYDEKSGKMRVYDTEVFNMLPHIPGEEKDEPDNPLEKSFKEKTDMLTSAFGSSKKKRVLDTRTRHAVDAEVLEGVMKSTVHQGMKEAHTYKTKTEEKKGTSQEMSTIPPCDKEATSVENVYKLSDILSERDLNDLQTSAKELFDCNEKKIEEWRKEEKYPTHVLNKLGTMPLDDTERWLRCKCLLYLSFLIKFYKLPQKLLGKNDALPPSCPMSIRRKLGDDFTVVVQEGTRSKRFRSDRMKDRLVSYILVLSLIIDDFHLVPLDLQADLKLGRIKMADYLRALGCRVSKPKDWKTFSYEAVLKLPLVFPAPKLIRK